MSLTKTVQHAIKPCRAGERTRWKIQDCIIYLQIASPDTIQAQTPFVPLPRHVFRV